MPITTSATAGAAYDSDAIASSIASPTSTPWLTHAREPP